MTDPDQLPAHPLTARLLAITSTQRELAKDYAEEYARGAVKAERERADALQAERDEWERRAKERASAYTALAHDAKDVRERADALEAALLAALKHAKASGMQGWPVFVAMERALLEKPQ